MNQYESMFILTPVLSDEQLREAVDRYRTLLKDNGCEVINDESWGLRKLAYPIQKKSTGFYQLFEFKADPAFIDQLELTYRRDERIIRFGTFRQDKHAVAYNIRKRSGVKAEQTQSVTEKEEA